MRRLPVQIKAAGFIHQDGKVKANVKTNDRQITDDGDQVMKGLVNFRLAFERVIGEAMNTDGAFRDFNLRVNIDGNDMVMVNLTVDDLVAPIWTTRSVRTSSPVVSRSRTTAERAARGMTVSGVGMGFMILVSALGVLGDGIGHGGMGKRRLPVFVRSRIDHHITNGKTLAKLHNF